MTLPRLPARLALPLALIAEFVVGYVDIGTGTEPLFELFYVVPLSIAA